MASFNRVILVGTLTRDVELKYTQSQLAVTEVGMAVNDRRKNANGEWVEEATFVDVTLWGRTAEVASQYLSKGSSILIEGRLKLDMWEADGGQKRSKLRVVGERMQMLGSRGSNSGGGPHSNQGASAGQYAAPAARQASNDFGGPSPDGPAGSGDQAGSGGPAGDDIPF